MNEQQMCVWTEHYEEGWSASCGMRPWYFPDGGTPQENGMTFCHHCGRRIAEPVPCAHEQVCSDGMCLLCGEGRVADQKSGGA